MNGEESQSVLSSGNTGVKEPNRQSSNLGMTGKIRVVFNIKILALQYQVKAIFNRE